MDPGTPFHSLLTLSCSSTSASSDDLLPLALPLLLQVSGAGGALVLAPEVEGWRVIGSAGAPIGPADVDALTMTARPVELPPALRSDERTQVLVRALPEGHRLVLTWRANSRPNEPALELALATLESALARLHAEVALTDLRRRTDHAQVLANMGDYDWHIATDTNTWSDQLFRIYGHEPGAIDPTYDKFLSMLHPDDRTRITGVHQEAYATGEPYQMIERIVRPDGEVRFLSSNGQVLMDEDGVPVRLRGTCVDITDQVIAEQQREHHASRFRRLVDSAPDAILVLDADLQVLEANPQAEKLLGADSRGRQIQEMFDDWPPAGTRAVPATALNGTGLLCDLTIADLVPEEDGAPGERPVVAVFLRDAGPRLDREAMVATLGEAKLRRRQALEINDNVVQGLVAASYALQDEQSEVAESYVHRTLAAARAMMDDLLEPGDGSVMRPGDLVRAAAAQIGRETRSGDVSA